MKIKSAEFELGAVRLAQWPADGLPEFAFIGRSNVGKSSLLNRLLNRKSLARVSGQPGKTQQINFYCINESFRFADLPGYGYAQVSKGTREQFLKMMQIYLSRREPLMRVFHLVDIRHTPSKDDLNWHSELVAAGMPVTVVATKADKLSKSKALQAVKEIRTSLRTPYQLLPVSAEKNTGIDALWEVIEQDIASGFDTDSLPSEAESGTGVGDQHAEHNHESADNLKA